MGCLNNEYPLLWVTRAEESEAKKKKKEEEEEGKNPGALLRAWEQTRSVRRGGEGGIGRMGSGGLGGKNICWHSHLTQWNL